MKVVQTLTAVNPIGRKLLQFRRSSQRYGQKGSFSKNQGYLSIARNPKTGQFVTRQAL